MFNPVVPTKEEIILGECRVYKDFGLAGSELLGATRGGSVVTIVREFRNVDFDGKYGDTKGLDIVTRVNGNVAVNMLAVSNAKFQDLFGNFLASTETVETVDYDIFTPSLDILDTDYHGNITLLGETAAGKDIFVMFENAINLGDIGWTFTSKDELVANCVFRASYDPLASTTVPIKIGYEKIV